MGRIHAVNEPTVPLQPLVSILKTFLTVFIIGWDFLFLCFCFHTSLISSNHVFKSPHAASDSVLFLNKAKC